MHLALVHRLTVEQVRQQTAQHVQALPSLTVPNGEAIYVLPRINAIWQLFESHT